MADAREVGRRFIDAFNAHDQQRIRNLNGDDTVFEAPGEVKVEGRDAATDYAMAWVRAFPDARITVHNEIVGGEWVVQEFTFTGTHEETLMSSTTSPTEAEQIEKANASGKTPVVFIHGLWLLPSSWDRWARLFEDAGYTALTQRNTTTSNASVAVRSAYKLKSSPESSCAARRGPSTRRCTKSAPPTDGSWFVRPGEGCVSVSCSTRMVRTATRRRRVS